ncbi:hypothetical protein [Chloroflexus sp.]|uniref:hypothetical protein n=1 Tax=Chloroflexus sp. TaxID=1904827 RepID=UPI00260B2F31|nr:hypothetical protein [uncultured Chloroflexus sp.]
MVLPKHKSLSEANPSREWFHSFGLRFDPYVHLEASSDPNLAEYILDLEIFRAAWDKEPTIIFAPPGGGKTATRVAVTRTCWFDMGGIYPFPLPYNVGITPLTGMPPSRSQHYQFLLEAGSCALLTGLAFRPERLLRASKADIRAINRLLRAGLPGSLDYYLAVLRETGSPAGLTRLLERTYALTTPPSAEMVNQFCVALGVNTDDISELSSSTPDDLFYLFVKLVTDTLGFSHVLVLVDGIDAISEHQSHFDRGLQWIISLLDSAAQWPDAKVIVKYFLPNSMEPIITSYLQRQSVSMRLLHIVWTADRLVELLQKRILAASDGRFESLDAISAPELIDVESRIVRALPLLPRAALQVTRHALQQASDQLEEVHLRQAILWYRSHMSGYLANINSS